MAPGSVLVVEDNLAMRALIRGLVEDAGLDVVECEDGEAAVALYTRHHPAWVLMDIKMPGMNGIDTTRAILAQDPAARVIIVTEQDESWREAAVVAGACGFVQKEQLLDLPALLRG